MTECRSMEYRGSACLEVGSALRADLVAPFSVPGLHDCLKVGRSLPWPPFAKARATTGQSLRSYQSPSADVIVITSLPRDSHSKGDRKPEDWPGAFLPGLGSRPSGPWFGCSGSGAGSGNPPSVICHRLSHLLRWRVSGIIHSALSGQFCHPSSVIDSAIFHAPPIRFRRWEFIFPLTQFFLELSHLLGI